MTATLQKVELDPPQFIKYVVTKQNQQILEPGCISCIYRWLGYCFLFLCTKLCSWDFNSHLQRERLEQAHTCLFSYLLEVFKLLPIDLEYVEKIHFLIRLSHEFYSQSFTVILFFALYEIPFYYCHPHSQICVYIILLSVFDMFVVLLP